jgi:hypothetical protein
MVTCLNSNVNWKFFVPRFARWREGFAALSGFELTASIAAVIIAGLCILGVWQRLREYL